jgi:hypothetical protein
LRTLIVASTVLFAVAATGLQHRHDPKVNGVHRREIAL